MAFNFWDIVPYWELMLFVILPIGLVMILVAKAWTWIRDFMEQRREDRAKRTEEGAGEKGAPWRMRARESFLGIDLMKAIVGLFCLLPLLIFVDYLFGAQDFDIYTVLLLEFMPLAWGLIVVYYILASIPYALKQEA